MNSLNNNKLKVINDPVHGFVTIPNELIYQIIQHPYFQRLRRISQTGLTELVYPGARHSRFHHALGCMHLMQKALNILKRKSVDITIEEENAALIAILLHDLGHGPFSHSLEHSIINGLHHEEVSLRLMEELNQIFENKLSVAIQIFKGEYHKKFLSQLVSSQLDVDRMDYLKRDSFYTGVVEGNINPERIISMMNVSQNELVIEAKGISSVEKFLMARMFMYMQVYMHKKSFTAENFLISVLKRAKELVKGGENLFATSAFNYFLEDNEKGNLSRKGLEIFTRLDDSDVLSSIKEWQFHDDLILSKLSRSIIERELPKSFLMDKELTDAELFVEKERVKEFLKIDDASYFVEQTTIKIIPYDKSKNPIKILFKSGEVKEISCSDKSLLTQFLQQEITKYHYHSIK
ncbi:HD domain-containing protein [Algoriella sp.]|uniref:HD domain-containing protein n=1 Tax=Algoriella sp. TaxID=1872434 RepID=UPI001B0CE2E2|nr:HD domain-containing protein [Algoriella sp.]MBO6212651.1 HD domain-containing protein [Algoriella sp.]